MTAQPSVVASALITLPSTCIQPPPPSGNEDENQVQPQTQAAMGQKTLLPLKQDHRQIL